MERGEGGPPWTEDESEAIRAIVQQATLALDSARLFEETQHRAGRERLINEITARIRSSATIEGVLNAAVREIGRATGAGYVAVDLTLAQTE
jgi:GAF domain-containing protein